jgi:membrane protease YdiL (CAAX protease family)
MFQSPRAVALAQAIGTTLLALVALTLAGAATHMLNPYLQGALATLAGGVGVSLLVAAGRPSYLALGAISPQIALRALLLGVALAVAGSVLIELERRAIPAFAATMLDLEKHYAELLRPADPRAIPAILLSVAVAPAFAEELLFRGVIRSQLASFLPASRIIIVAALFACLHVMPPLLLPIFVVSLFWTTLGERAGGWLAPAFVHFAFNGFNGVVMPRLASTEELPTSQLLLLGGGMCVLAALLLRWALAAIPPQSDASPVDR